jgi:hypothetical protein
MRVAHKMTVTISGYFLHDDLAGELFIRGATGGHEPQVLKQDDEVRLYCAKAGAGLTNDWLGSAHWILY